MSEQPALVVEDLHVYRGQAHVLQGASLTVPARGVTALLGRNGVGKTTTLLGVMGLLRSTGLVELAGESIQGKKTHEIVRSGVGYVPENREVFGRLTVKENLRLAERGAGLSYDRVYELFPELEARAQQRAGSLSGGQQQMLALARALLNPNQVLLIDEPTEGLAPVVVDAVVESIKRVATTTPILLVEQNLRVAKQLAELVVVLVQGKVAYSGTAEEFFAQPELSETLIGVQTAGKEKHG